MEQVALQLTPLKEELDIPLKTYGWNIKPIIFVVIPLVMAMTVYASFNVNLSKIIGLAWDCGAVTTGAVTVPLVLALGIGVALGQSTGNLMLAIGISSAPAYIRMMRGATISEKERMYVTAGRVTGCSDAWIMFKHILPNCLSPMIVTATMNLGGAIMAEASLSYLGLGIVPPTPAWGSMVSDGFSYIKSNPLLSIAPGVCIMIVVLAFNILGDGLRDMLDPRIRSSL